MKRTTLVLIAALFVPQALVPLVPLAPFAGRAEAQTTAPIHTVDIVVEDGYTPSRIELPAGERVRLRFVRRETNPCTEHVVFPTLGIRRRLPPNQVVVIELPPQRPSTVSFRCGMEMIHGTLTFRARTRR